MENFTELTMTYLPRNSGIPSIGSVSQAYQLLAASAPQSSGGHHDGNPHVEQLCFSSSHYQSNSDRFPPFYQQQQQPTTSSSLNDDTSDFNALHIKNLFGEVTCEKYLLNVAEQRAREQREQDVIDQKKKRVLSVVCRTNRRALAFLARHFGLRALVDEEIGA